jgi:hypothetical protein
MKSATKSDKKPNEFASSSGDDVRIALKAARSLAANLTDAMLEDLRPLWGNTNVAVLRHWRTDVLRQATGEPASLAAGDPVGGLGTEGPRAPKDLDLRVLPADPAQERIAAIERQLLAGSMYRLSHDDARYLLDLLQAQAERLAQVEQEIDKNLDWLKKSSFIIERKGLLAVVDHSDAMHALLFVRKALRALAASPADTIHE